MNTLDNNWSSESWKLYEAKQQPDWRHHPKLTTVKQELVKLPPLVFAGEIEKLKKTLNLVSEGKAFILQGGDCAENFDECSSLTIRETLKVLLQMAVMLTYAGGKPVVKIGRIAGQFAKPRSNSSELIDGVELPVYRGDMVNKNNPDLESRKPNPLNMLEGYFRSTATLNLLRAFTKGGFASLKNIHKWNKDFLKDTPSGQKFEDIAGNIDEALDFMSAIGLDINEVPQLKEVNFYTSHEALLLDYEEAMTRKDSLTGLCYGCSAHLLWIGERTRQLDGAHVEYMRGINNPIGIKVSANYEPDDICRVIEKINPQNEPGKMVLISRMGVNKINDALPKLLNKIQKEGFHVVWICDPMHGNTFTTPNHVKTRSFDTIFSEIKSFFDIHHAEGTIPGGIHIELTGLNVTECVGGAQDINEQTLSQNYASTCDPRLNAKQSIELAFKLSEMIRNFN